MHRRAFLATLPFALAGCTGPNGTDTAEPTANASTTPSTPGSAPPAAVSTPTESCEPVDRPSGPIDYPDFPESLTEPTATEFVGAVEEASAAAEVEARGDDFDGVDGQSVQVERGTDEGFLLRAEVQTDFTSEGDGGTVTGSDYSRGWYFVTAAFAVRAPLRGDELPEYGWETIACAPRD